MIAKYDGKCAKCGKKTIAGTEIIYDRNTRQVFHPGCLDRIPVAKPELKYGQKVWFVDIPYDQSTLRSQVKASGFRWHGPDRCGSGKCFACNLGVPSKWWYTTDYAVANTARAIASKEAIDAIDELIRVEKMSKSASVDYTVPAPDGLGYYPYQLAGVQWLEQFPRTMIGDEPGLGKT